MNKKDRAENAVEKVGKISEETVGKKETVYYFALNVASKGITYFLLVAFANLFSISDYGQASFAIMIYTIASAFVFPGLGTLFVPAYIKKKDVSSLFFFSGAVTFAFALGTLFVGLKYSLVWPLALCFVFSWLALPAKCILRAEHKYHLLQLTEMFFVLSDLAFVFYWRGLGDVGNNIRIAGDKSAGVNIGLAFTIPISRRFHTY